MVGYCGRMGMRAEVYCGEGVVRAKDERQNARAKDGFNSMDSSSESAATVVVVMVGDGHRRESAKRGMLLEIWG
eukprot:jgi/Psemu1/11578/gm1.11578_g